MGYVKSYSNYILRSKHKTTKDGTIFERDYTTIGGVDNFAKGQVPIYRTGNFLMTINAEENQEKKYGLQHWAENEEGVVWTLDNVEDATADNNSDSQIILKNDYRDLSDYAYYGSCAELIRGSLNDILTRFPGELFVTSIKSENGAYYVDNPFNINIITRYVNEKNIDNKLKFLVANNWYTNYEIIVNGNANPITSVSVEKDGNGNFVTTINNITITSITNCSETIYLSSSQGVHIRPKKHFLQEFYDSLDGFESALLNPKTEPKHKAIFRVTRENEKGFYDTVEDFIFPVSSGGYNIGGDANAYNAYLSKFLEIANFYDETFSDNLYRMMTHESIKNFDFSYKTPNKDAEIYEFSSNKIEKLIRLFGREFDEIKFYIDGIRNYNLITYNGRNNLPDYFLTDTLELDGWDTISIIPIYLSKEDNCGRRKVYQDMISTVTPYTKQRLKFQNGYFTSNSDGSCASDCSSYFAASSNENFKVITNGNNKTLVRKISKYSSEQDYSYKEVNNEFLKRLKLNSKDILRHKGTITGIEMMFGMFGLTSKRFRENESISNSLCVDDEKGYDYDITEFVNFTNGLEDMYWDCKDMTRLNWYNYTKTFQYSTQEYKNNIYVDYQGLPVIDRNVYYQGTSKINDIKEVLNYDPTTRTLSYLNTKNDEITKTNCKENKVIYPYYDSNSLIDGTLYYQMNGGWMMNNISFNSDNQIVTNVYTETLNDIKTVGNVSDLFNIPMSDLTNGDVYYVNNLKGHYICINGILYQLYTDYNGYEYFTLQVYGHTVSVGNTLFNGTIYVSNPYGDCSDESVGAIRIHNLSSMDNSEVIKIYVIKNGENKYVTFKASAPNTIGETDFNYYLITDQIYSNNTSLTKDNFTHYFKIVDNGGKNYLDEYGWIQLPNTSEDYKKITTVKNYFKGNNPHTGHLNYDKGFAYMDYFANLFNEAYIQEAFDRREYGETYFDELNIIGSVGFKNITKQGLKDYNLYADEKVHYFGDYFSEGGQKTYDINNLSSWKDSDFYQSMANNINTNISTLKDDSNNIVCRDYNVDGCTHQIVNTKVIRINIYLHSDTIDYNEIKYYQDVVMQYVAQMIPSTAILEVNYKTKNEQPNCNLKISMA